METYIPYNQVMEDTKKHFKTADAANDAHASYFRPQIRKANKVPPCSAHAFEEDNNETGIKQEV